MLVEAAWLFIAATAVETAGQTFYAEGFVTAQLHRRAPADTFSPPSPRRFTVHVNDEKWLIRVYHEQSKRIDYAETGSDGKALYSYTAFHERPAASEIVNSGVARIEPDPVPGEAGDYVQYVWTALASHRYFTKLVVGQPIKPLWHVSKHEASLVQWNASLSSTPPFLPPHVVYLRPPGAFPPPFDEGWVGAEFRWLTETNINGFTLPLEFEYVQYRPMVDASNTSHVEPQATVKGKLAVLSFDDRLFDPRPELHGITLVEDHRYSDFRPPINRVQYSVTNNYWPDLDDSTALVAYQMRAGLPEREIDGLSRIVVFLVLLVALFMIVFWRKLSV